MGILESALIALTVAAMLAFWGNMVLRPGYKLESEYRYGEAGEAFAQAVEKMLPWDQSGKMVAMLRAALAYNDAGDPGRGILWAERALKQEGVATLRAQAFLVAAHIHASLGDAERVEWYLGDAQRLAEELDNDALTAQAMLLYANQRLKAGEIREVYLLAERIVALAADKTGMAQVLRGECLRAEGRFDDAIAMYQESARNVFVPETYPAAEAAKVRLKRVSDMAIAQALIEAGRAGEAEPYLSQVAATLQNDHRIMMLCDSLATWMLARVGNSEQSRTLETSLTDRLDRFGRDHIVLTTVYARLGMAALARKEYRRGLEWLDRCRQMPPELLEEPRVWWEIAKGRKAMGDRAGATEALKRAVSRQLPTHYSKLAQAALDVESQSAPPDKQNITKP